MIYFHRERGMDNIYDDLIYPGMKKAVLCSLLSTQDVVEYRKVGRATQTHRYQNSCRHMHSWVTSLNGHFSPLTINWHHIDGLVQDCGKSIANALELPQSCIKSSIGLLP